MRWIDYIRVLFPSWRFFERPSSIVQIQVKDRSQTWKTINYIELASFLMSSTKPKTLRFNNLLYNPIHNFALYLEGYVHELSVQIASQPTETKESVENCPNFNFTHELIQRFTSSQKVSLSVEYRLCSVSLDGHTDCFLHFTGDKK